MRPDPTWRRVALFGNFGAGNLGNEATLQAMMQNLRARLPNVEIRCICSGPEATARAHGIVAAPIAAPLPTRTGRPPGAAGPPRPPARPGRLRTALRALAWPALQAYRVRQGIVALKGCDALVMTGTGMLGDAALQPEILRWAIIAKLCRCKLLFVSVGGGPVRRLGRRWCVRTALALADSRSYRDVASKRYLAEIGAEVGRDPVYPDLAFGLPDVAACAGRQTDGSAVIGIGVMNWYGGGSDAAAYHEYLARMALLVMRLLERGCGVRVLIGDARYDEPVRQDLRALLEAGGVRYAEGGVVDEPAASVDALLAQLASVDVVVSARFHNLLLAMMLGKPVCAISYHEKFQPLMDDVGLGGFCQDIAHVDVDDLLGKIAVLHENAAEIRLRLAAETESYRAALDEQYERILAQLSDRRGQARRTTMAAAARPQVGHRTGTPASHGRAR